MSSLQTFFRTVVMLATLGIVAKIWFLYGPSVGEMQTIGVAGGRALAADVERLLEGIEQRDAAGGRLDRIGSPRAVCAVGRPDAADSVAAAERHGTWAGATSEWHLARTLRRVAPQLSPAAPTNAVPPAGATLVPMDSPTGD